MAMGAALALARKMAGGKKRIDAVQWQFEVTNDEEWQELCQLPGLVVVDVYQDWCGPCLAMATHLKEIKLQLGDELLHCATARADSIEQLSNFRGRSEPTWIFMAAGECVSVIKGANVPLIRSTLLDELQKEKEVLAGNVARNVIPWESIKFQRPRLFAKAEEEESEKESVSHDEERQIFQLPEDWNDLTILCINCALIGDQADEIRQKLRDVSLEINQEGTVEENDTKKLIFWLKSIAEDVESSIEEVHRVLEAYFNVDEDALVDSEVPEETVPKFALLVNTEEKEEFIRRFHKEEEEEQAPSEGNAEDPSDDVIAENGIDVEEHGHEETEGDQVIAKEHSPEPEIEQ